MATLKQKAAAARILENHGNVSKTMLEVGYSPATAKNPMELTESKGWQELMEQQIPDTLVIQTHRKLLEHENYKANSSGVDMAYKLKGKYAPEKHVTLEIEVEPSEELTHFAHGLLDQQKDS